MKVRSKKLLSLFLAVGMVTTSLTPAMTAKAEGPKLVGDIQTERYISGDKSKPGKEYPDDENSKMTRDKSEFMKISHPELPPNRRDFDPTVGEPGSPENNEAREKHKAEVAPDGLIDYLGHGKLGEPKEGGTGDRGQSYSWTGISHGDWMYVSTQFNSAGSTGDIMGRPANPEQADKRFGGDYFTGETDEGNPGSTLSKINVKTGETVILMAASKNGLDAQFRASIEYKGKLYFCGSVNHVPSIYEVDPTNDALKCVYRDPSMVNYPGNPEKGYPAGVAGAWMEAKGDKNICPAIRGITTFKTPDADGKDGEEYLVISCVGVDENPYIAVSNNPSSGKFDIIAHAWDEVPTYMDDGFKTEGGKKGELFGYPACHLRDSIFGGSIWEMVQFDGKLYVAMCTGTPETAEIHTGNIEDEDGKVIEENHRFIDTMQSFALVCGEYDPSKNITDKDAWTWTPVVGDDRSIEKGGDNAAHPFGIDPERTRAGACNLVVFDDHLYIGEYNDTQIAFINMNDKDFKFLKRNLEQSISYYRMDKDQNFEKVMGSKTKKFPKPVVEDKEGYNAQSGFGQKSSQYIWQSRVFDGKLYFGTFDETMILQPLAKEASKNMEDHGKKVGPELQTVSDLIDENAVNEGTEAEAATYSADSSEDEFTKLKEVRDDFKAAKENGQFYADLDIDTENGTILAPEGTTEREPLVKIESTEDLYLALLVLEDLMTTPAKGGIPEEITKFSDCVNLQNEISTYAAEPANEVPSYMDSSVKAAEGSASQQEKYEEMQYIVKNLEGCVAGFDMYSSEDGTNFKQITRSGLGDPYNQGLRAFATNEDSDNKWMCIGSANGFWGTSIYRMNTNATTEIKDPAQTRIKLKFVGTDGVEIDIDPDKSPFVYVNAGETKILPKEIAGLSPVNFKPSKPDTEVDIVDGVATIEVVPNALVSINYKDGDKIIKTADAPHTKGNTTVQRKYVEQNLPEGYVISSDEKKFEVQPAATEGQNDFIDVQVKKAFNITVESGKADKTKAAVGDKVTITADEAPEGKAFRKWVETTPAAAEGENTAVVFEDETNPKTTFVMPANDVKVEATYHTPVIRHKVTVEGGTADFVEAAKGDTVTIKAEVPEGKEFVNWTGEGVEFADANAAETTFIMPGNAVTVTANFKDSTFKITVNGGTSNVAEAKKGDTVKIKAEVPSDNEFVNWTGEGVEFADASAAETTFVMPGKNVTVTANFKNKVYYITVEGGTSSVKTANKGDTVTVKADVPEDKEFANWTGEGVEFADANAVETTFVMPEKDVTITANFKEKAYKVTVKGGKADVKTAKKGDTVAVKAELPENEEFVNWTGEGVEFADAEAEETTFVMPGKDVTVTANSKMRNGWVKVGNDWYYYEKGEKHTGWLYNNGKWYNFDTAGVMRTGWLHTSGPSAATYYLAESGEMVTDWKYIGGNWYYFDRKNGERQDGWFYVDNAWYYSNSSGVMQTGWEKVDGSWYYFKSSGAMTRGWSYIGGSWYYFRSSGAMATGWVYMEGTWYYFRSSGAMATGWQYIDGAWFFFKSSGAMATGWSYIDGNWYYFKSSGVMYTGWAKISGSWYYFYNDGRMARNITIDGCRLNSDGVWV